MVETNAINTAGLWHGYVMVDGKIIWQNREGYADRDLAIDEAHAWKAIESQKQVYNQPSALDTPIKEDNDNG